MLITQTLKDVALAVGVGFTTSETGTVDDSHGPLSTVAYTVVEPLVKDAGLFMGLVPAALVHQFTIPAPPRMVAFSEVRLKLAWLPPDVVAQAFSGPAALAEGVGVTVKTTGISAELQKPFDTAA